MIGVGLAIPEIAVRQPGQSTLAEVIAGTAPAYDVDFMANTSNTGGVINTAANAITFTRATVGWADKLDGSYQSFISGAPRITDRGILIEETRTNVVLRARDLSNAAWTKTGTSATKDQVGIDGAAASASALYASADAGTCSQTITLASSARYQSVFLKRIAGSGLVEMSMDNSTFTAVTPTSSAWVRFEIATQTIANPTVVIRMATAGDAIGVDFVQNENGTYATSPIDATTVALARAADLVKAITPTWLSSTAGSVYINATIHQFTNNSTTPWFLSDGSVNNRVHCILITGPKMRSGMTSGAAVQAQIDTQPTNFVTGTPYKHSVGYALNDYVTFHNSLAGTPDTVAALPVSMNDVRFYSTVNPIGIYRIKRFTYWASRLSSVQLRGITA